MLLQLRSLYNNQGFTTAIEDDYILVSFKDDKVNIVVKYLENLKPLSLAQTQEEYRKLAIIGEKYNCYQYKLVSIVGYESDAYKLTEFNLSLCTREYLQSLENPNHIELYSYNEITYNKVIDKFKESNRCCVVQATGTGKSLIIAKFINEHSNKKIIVFTPSVFIIDEIKKHIIKHAAVDFRTYQSLLTLTFKEIKLLQADYIILDEFHRAGAEQWEKQLNKLFNVNFNAKILGTSATPIRYLDNHRNMADELFNNNIVTHIKLAHAIAYNILPIPLYVSALYTFDQEYKNMKDKINNPKYKINPEDRKKYLEKLNHTKLLWEQSYGIVDIVKKYLPQDLKKIMVFCKDVEHLNTMKPVVLNWFKDAGFLNAKDFEIHSKTPQKNKTFQAFEQQTEHLHILFSVDMFNEGIHVKGNTAVMLLRETQSPIIYYQQIGRCFETSQNSQPIILDLINNFNYIDVKEFHRDYNAASIDFQNRSRELKIPYTHKEFIVHDEIKNVQKLFNDIAENLNTWENNFQEYKILRDTNQPITRKENIYYYRWEDSQKVLYKKTKLSEERIDLLKPYIDFDKLKSKDDIQKQWYINFEEYKKLRDTNQPITVKENKVYYTWQRKQRKKYIDNLLTEEQILLLKPYIDFENLKTGDDIQKQWFINFEEYKRLRDSNQPITKTENDGCYRWVQHQKSDYKSEKLTEERYNLLKPYIDFENIKSKNLQSWEDAFEEYKRLCDSNQSITAKENKVYYRWQRKQKTYFKQGKLTEEQILLLKSYIDFEDIINEEDIQKQWYINFEEYKRLCDSNQPITKTENKVYYTWKQKQKAYFKQEKLTEERYNLLKPYIDFENVITVKSWEIVFEEYKLLLDSNQPITPKENKVYYTWMQNQKAFYKRGNLSKERINLLKPYIDFDKLKSKDDIQKQWYINFEEYKKLRDTNQPITVKENKFYYNWHIAQIMNYKKSNLSEEKINFLKHYIDFENLKEIQKVDENWVINFEEYKRLCDSNQPITPKENTFYSTWESKQKAYFKQGKLIEERYNLLKPYIDFENLPNIKNIKSWEIVFEEYKLLLDTNQPITEKENTFYYSWLANQKHKYKKRKLTEEQYNLLKPYIDFDNVKTIKSWEIVFEEYKLLLDTNQPITKTENKVYYNWEQKQRKKYIDNLLTEEQILLLKPYIDFEKVKTKIDSWKDSFEEYKRLRDTNQPITKTKNKVFYCWQQTQKAFYKKEKLSQEKINLLKPYIDFDKLK